MVSAHQGNASPMNMRVNMMFSIMSGCAQPGMEARLTLLPQFAAALLLLVMLCDIVIMLYMDCIYESHERWNGETKSSGRTEVIDMSIPMDDMFMLELLPPLHRWPRTTRT